MLKISVRLVEGSQLKKKVRKRVALALQESGKCVKYTSTSVRVANELMAEYLFGGGVHDGASYFELKFLWDFGGAAE
jgi:hypothetical protein